MSKQRITLGLSNNKKFWLIYKQPLGRLDSDSTTHLYQGNKHGCLRLWMEKFEHSDVATLGCLIQYLDI